jgi:DNA-directed RNA polymerase specialized sigma24 family protein
MSHYKSERRRRIYKILRVGAQADELIAQREKRIRERYASDIGVDPSRERIDGGEQVPAALRMMIELETDKKIQALKAIRTEYHRIMDADYLSKREREVVIKRFIQRKKHVTIADEESISLNGAIRAVVRAISRIDKHLDEDASS